MRQKVSDYIANFLVKNEIREVFTVPGGLAMHMNDSFGHHEKLRCTYHHHEQACAMAAEAYARVAGRPAAVDRRPSASRPDRARPMPSLVFLEDGWDLFPC